jgi:hypothetical protein
MSITGFPPILVLLPLLRQAMTIAPDAGIGKERADSASPSSFA